MPCPFGFVGDEEEEQLLNGEDADGEGDIDASINAKKGPGRKAEGKSHTESKSNTAAKGDPATAKADDPLAWFYSNQLKTEKEFQARKDQLRKEARKRLDDIMDKKKRRLMWPSDSEFDNMSVSSGELSDLDSDVHSLASIRSCAYSWIQYASYKTPAEITFKVIAIIMLITSIVVMYISYRAMDVSKPLPGMVTNHSWPSYCFLAGLLMIGSSGASIMASNWRSKRFLLGSEVLALLTLCSVVVMATLLFSSPMEVDAQMSRTMCGTKWTGEQRKGRDIKPPFSSAGGAFGSICAQLPQGQAGVITATLRLKWSMMVEAVLCLALAGVGMWYMLELCFIEKKGVKHTKRHRRRRFAIPWDKIKIEGPPLPCGQTGPAAGTQQRGGTTWAQQTGSKSACPVFPNATRKDKDA